MYLMIHGVIVQWYDIDYDSLITQCVIIILSLCQTFSFLSIGQHLTFENLRTQP